jgi:peroxiredoxin
MRNFARSASRALLSIGLAVVFAPATQLLAGELEGKAPNFRGVDLEGKQVSLEDLKGRGPIVMHFWATWCKPCLKELPYVQRLHDEYGEKGLTVLAVSIDLPKDQSRVKPFVQGRNFTFRVLLDSTQEIFKSLQGKGQMPYVVVLDADGVIRYRHTGYRPGDEKALEKVVVGLMGPSREGTSETPTEPEAAPVEKAAG